MWLYVLCSALATPGLSGLGVPGAGGFVGTTEPGVLGVLHNPAAAARSEGPEFLADVGLIELDVFVSLDDVPEVDGGTTQLGPPQPTLAVAVPVGRFGIGGAVHVPYARFNDQSPDDATRLYGYSSNVLLVEADLTGSYAVNDHFSVGVGLRLGAMPGFRNYAAVDTGDLVNEALSPDPPLPVGTAFLEGDLRVRGSALGASWMVGASAILPGDIELHASFRPPWRLPVRGTMALQPSRALSARVQGDLQLDFPFPYHLKVAARVPVGAFTLMPDLEVVGWQAAGRVASRPSNLKLVTADPAWDGVLAAAGLAEGDFLAGLAAEGVEDLQWHDIVIWGAQAQWRTELRPGVPLAVRVGAWRAPRVMGTNVTSLANLDFGTVTVRAAASVRPVPALELVPGFDYLHSPRVRVVDSPAKGAIPSGNGVYDAEGWRANLNAVWRPGARR